ncbi:hypothetical protein [Hyalangium versicolor]|uniref:hypothetical protein n=1 Tax=Hyalangium versicolor TaxID=2861190 RepID=UPI001CCE055B|nr:hypothetical protein [Hyalangium versicolor]
MSNNWGLLAEELEKRRHAFVAIPGKGTLVIRRIRGNDLSFFQQLEGLAVPQTAVLSEEERKVLVGDYADPILATHYAGRWLGYYPFTPGQLIGAWLFLLEQFVAIRRRGWLYTDIKFANVVCRPGVQDVRIIDLEGCLPLTSEDAYLVDKVPYSLKFTAPEHVTLVRKKLKGESVKEAAIVYQLGILPACAMGALKRLHIRTPLSKSWKLFREQFGERYARFYKLCRTCAHPRIDRRPATFEALLEQAHAALSGTEYRRAWKVRERLRAPYGPVLASLGL